MKLILGDSLQKLKDLPTSTIDCVVTDPPYGWRFMGKAWDAPDIMKMALSATGKEPRLCADGKIRKPREDCKSIAAGKYDNSIEGNQAFMHWTSEWAAEVMRVLKPGGHMLVFCGPRTYHAMAMGVEMAGFEIRDQMQWLFGSGFPKSHNIGNGMGTALKPANEPICLARKPLEKGLTVAQNVQKWGTGALNIDGTRIEGKSNPKAEGGVKNSPAALDGGVMIGSGYETHAQGRWPANVLFDEAAASMLDEQSGTSKSGSGNKSKGNTVSPSGWVTGARDNSKEWTGDSGGASRFFYVAKASKRERNAGLEGMPTKRNDSHNNPSRMVGSSADKAKAEMDTSGTAGNANHHPTVKPVKLMEYLIKLVCPPGGIVLDPFMGSGTTGVAATNLGAQFIGIERESEYLEIARRRIEFAAQLEMQFELGAAP